MLSYALDHAIWGLNPVGYHLTNIVFHTLNTFLVFVLALRLIEYQPNSPIPLFNKEGVRGCYPSSLVAASVTAILFGIHPLHVESVTWVSERKDVLCAFFFLLGLIYYVRYSEQRHRAHYYFSLIYFVLALTSKAMAVSLPAVLLILDFYPLRRLDFKNLPSLKKVVAEKLPFILFSTIFSVVSIMAQGEAVHTLYQVPLGIRSLIGMYAYAFYLFKVLMPANLAPLYPFPLPGDISLFAVEYSGSIALLIMITLYSIKSARWNRLFLTVWAYYLVTLLPVIGIIHIGEHFAADRYTYLPSLGPFLLAGIGTALLFEKCSDRRHVIAITLSISLAVILMTVKTVRQIRLWHDSETLWTYNINLFPDTAYMPYLNRGHAYIKTGNYNEAARDINKAIELYPPNPVAHYNLGLAYNKLGRIEEAVKEYKTAIELEPDNLTYRRELAGIYYKSGIFGEALNQYLNLIKARPDVPEYHNDIANVYYKMERFDDALQEYQTAIRLKPDFVYAHYNLGKVYLNIGLKDKAKEEFEAALMLKPDFLPARQEIGLMPAQQ